MEKFDVISFRKLIPAGAKGYYDYEVMDNGTLEQVYIYFAQGQQFELHITPVIIQSGLDVPTPIFTAANNTETYLSGDNAEVERKVARPLTTYDKIRVYYDNTDAVNAMHLVCDVTIDYYAGKVRLS